jgi:hypothetical protein
MASEADMAAKREITLGDIMAPADYAAKRRELKSEISAKKRDRRVAVGPDATFYFESYDTMWHQVHEMLHIEKGGRDQIPDELAAYNPLIPNGHELVATVMFEIADPGRRARVLGGLGGVEETFSITVSGQKIAGIPEEDVDRTNAAGKASSVQFVHFPFSPDQIEAFRSGEGNVIVAVGHENYAHMAVMPAPVRTALAADFD